MKKCLLLLLIGLMVLGLTLSVLAANSRPTWTPSGGTVTNIETAAGSPSPERTADFTPGKPLAATALAGNNNRTALLTFVRRIVCGLCGLLMVYTQLGFAFLGGGSRTKEAWHSMAFSSFIYSIGMLRYQGWLFLRRFLNQKKEQEEVCYG
jgi:hypothetical protein